MSPAFQFLLRNSLYSDGSRNTPCFSRPGSENRPFCPLFELPSSGSLTGFRKAALTIKRAFRECRAPLQQSALTSPLDTAAKPLFLLYNVHIPLSRSLASNRLDLGHARAAHMIDAHPIFFRVEHPVQLAAHHQQLLFRQMAFEHAVLYPFTETCKDPVYPISSLITWNIVAHNAELSITITSCHKVSFGPIPIRIRDRYQTLSTSL